MKRQIIGNDANSLFERLWPLTVNASGLLHARPIRNFHNK